VTATVDGAGAPRLIEWTGERCVPWTDDVQVVYEHLARYHLAARVAPGRRVVDVGSGEGYGAAILAERAAEVVGIELDPASVAHSRRAHPRANLRFVEGSVLDAASYGDRPFDLAVCFEVLEHLTEQERLLDTIRSRLAAGGLLLISTPDRDVYSAPGTVPNPYHLRELSRAEFAELLRSRFAHVAVWGQWALCGAHLELLDDGQGAGGRGQPAAVVVAPAGDGWRTREVPAPEYLVAAASAAPLPSLPSSWDLRDLQLELVAGCRRELALARARVAELEAAVARASRSAPATLAVPAVSALEGCARRGLRLIRRAGRRLAR
jgi:SAM-dependent methyltransferase